VPHLRDGLIVAKVGHFHGSENPDALKLPMLPGARRYIQQVRPKINLERVENFRARKMTVNLPAFHQQSTTNSPSKNHILLTVFAKTPSKNG
jgi:hypothetical protein